MKGVKCKAGEGGLWVEGDRGEDKGRDKGEIGNLKLREER